VGLSDLHRALTALALLLGAASEPPPDRQIGISYASVAAPNIGSIPSKTFDWRAATREDVLQAYEIFRHHHPGMFDPSNPGFPAQLRRARDEALAFVPNVHDDEGHMRALALFNSVLADGHAHVVVGYNGHGLVWPGFDTVWRDHALHILDAAADGGWVQRRLSVPRRSVPQPLRTNGQRLAMDDRRAGARQTRQAFRGVQADARYLPRDNVRLLITRATIQSPRWNRVSAELGLPSTFHSADLRKPPSTCAPRPSCRQFAHRPQPRRDPSFRL